MIDYDEKVIKFIEEHKLDTRSRKRESVYMRMAIARFLRDKQFTLTEIGSYLNRDHASIFHYLEKYEYCKGYKDFQILEDRLKIAISSKVKRAKDYNEDYKKYLELRRRVLNITSQNDLYKLKDKLLKEIRQES
jgi:tRNA splicing ligase